MRHSTKDIILYTVIAVFFAATFIGVLVYGYSVQETNVWIEKQTEMGYIGEKSGGDLQSLLQSYLALADKAAFGVLEAKFETREEYIDYFQRFVAENKAADAAYLALDNTETYFDNWTAPDGYDPKIRAWYKQGKAGGGKPVFSDPYIDGITGNLVVSSLKKVTMPDGTEGVVGIDVSLNELSDIINAIRPTANGTAYLLGPDTIFITHTDPELLPKIVNDEEVYTKRSDLEIDVLETSKDNASTTRIIDYDGIEKYNYMASIPAVPGWSLGLAVPVDDFAADVSARINSLLPLVMLGGIVAVFCAVLAIILTLNSKRQSYWYISILDAIPMPLSVTDMDMRWTFINKAVEDFLGKKRAEVLGQKCSNWNAAICNTENCGITCLRRGQSTTQFNQMGMDFKVDSSYIKDSNGKNAGHVEVVQDISSMVKTQNAQSELIQSINQISGTFVTGSKQIADGSQSLAQGATQQAAAIEQLSSSIAVITKQTDDNAEMAGKAANLAETIKKNAEKGNIQMNHMLEAVKEISDAGQKINKVIKVIDDIAFQTNILALNAAVEAARAGQHGKGFAVVAEEVRSLAAKSAEAAKDTGSLIANSIEKSEMGSRIATETAESLHEIVTGVNESSRFISEIARSSGEQSLGIAQINQGIDQVSQVVQQNSATAEQSAAASQELSQQAQVLEDLVSQSGIGNGNRLPGNPQDTRALPGASS